MNMNSHGAGTNTGGENSCAMLPDQHQGAQICHLVIMITMEKMMIMVITKMMMMMTIWMTLTWKMTVTEQGKRAVFPASSLTT